MAMRTLHGHTCAAPSAAKYLASSLTTPRLPSAFHRTTSLGKQQAMSGGGHEAKTRMLGVSMCSFFGSLQGFKVCVKNTKVQIVGLKTSASAKREVQGTGKGSLKGSEVRVRFAPSPTGNLHVGGARTALFNYLFAKSLGGKFILRIEDTDLERSTRDSEEAVICDLQWLGLEWDEGPDRKGEYGPYRQSERTHIYRQYVDKLVESGHVYRCFCTDEELEAMREEAKLKALPPRYMGKWGSASQAEIDVELEKGTPYTFRFRVPQEGSVTIQDLIRGEVSWSKDTLGDFVVLRSNGQPVYNFCVAVDDATMHISHVIRAEEHLPNTLRQALIYNALGFPMPQFGHVSLILAPDRSKLSKRHGATSVGQFREMGFLAPAMVNYLALLGWNDGTEDEIFTVDQIIQKFSIDRVTKSGAIFDQTKLQWMNGQHLRSLPTEELASMLGNQWVKAGILSEYQEAFVNEATELLKNGLELVADSEEGLLNILGYPLHLTLASNQVKEIVDDNITEVVSSIVAAYDSGELQAVIDGDHDAWQKWIKGIGKTFKRKGKRLFMPVRIALTGRMQGPEMGAILRLLREGETSGIITEKGSLVPLSERIKVLREVDWTAVSSALENSRDIEPVTVLSH
ncbi:unnamed protein product [Sphagnum jensenii]|uniref:glutamate--tRNA ligase n=1 Tax=Sphagnum jensenii TaxID=128206 RepID=A0ABP0XI88_9BRYO